MDNIPIQVSEGEIYGFLGLNGAGKTTLIRILLGMIRQNSGQVSLFGENLSAVFSRWNDVGYLVETPYSYPNLSVIENLAVYHALRQLENKNLIDETIEKLHLTAYLNTKAKHLSLGNKQRLGLAKALMHKMKLLILDEPVNGLDPEGIVEVRELLQDLAVKGTAIFLSSHILGEISKLANRIAIIHRGKLLEELNSDELQDRLTKKLFVNTNDNNAAMQHLRQYNAILEGDEIAIDCKQAVEKLEDISALLAANGLPAKQIVTFTEDLEGYFLRTIKEKADE
ncbi:MAG: ABC transporter ATP-binding protein [Treponematales bacterium]